MAEEVKTFKNTRLSVYGDETIVYDSSGNNGQHFSTKEWDVEVTLTRKIKPFKDGSVLLDEVQRWMYFKVQGTWYYVSTETVRTPEVRASIATDAEFRVEVEVEGSLKLLHEEK